MAAITHLQRLASVILHNLEPRVPSIRSNCTLAEEMGRGPEGRDQVCRGFDG
jgi:hypothetical protein